jgi:hypothetical protein
MTTVINPGDPEPEVSRPESIAARFTGSIAINPDQNPVSGGSGRAERLQGGTPEEVIGRRT